MCYRARGKFVPFGVSFSHLAAISGRFLYIYLLCAWLTKGITTRTLILTFLFLALAYLFQVALALGLPCLFAGGVICFSTCAVSAELGTGVRVGELALVGSGAGAQNTLKCAVQPLRSCQALQSRDVVPDDCHRLRCAKCKSSLTTHHFGRL